MRPRSPLFLLLLPLACAAPLERASPSGVRAYVVTVERGGERLGVEAVFPPGAELVLAALPVTEGFLDDVAPAGDEHALERVRGGFALPASDVERRVHWTFRARDAGRALDDGEIAAWHAHGFAGSLAAFLLRDEDAPRDARMRLRVELAGGTSFACALPSTPRDEPAGAVEYAAGVRELELLPACVFGDVRVQRLERTDHLLVLAELEPRDGPHEAALLDWVTTVEAGIARYFGRFPVERLLLVVAPHAGPGVGSGRTRGYGGAAIAIDVNANATARELRADWVLWHEMIHLALPGLAPAHEWLSEGSATYVEPLLRARAGLASAEEVWAATLAEYPQGLPAPGDRGLDREHAWGRTYYGGALFCLEADLEIRARTGNRRSLRDALAAVVAAGGDTTVDWPIERVLAIGDAATGVDVLSALYAERRAAPGPLALEPLWERLGVRASGGGVVFDDAAPLADVRRALVLGP